MSFDALAWAGKCRAGSAGRKLVLLALADRHNTEEAVSRPSIAWIAEWTDLNRKTVIAALQELERIGLISDSGERAGKTGQIKAYHLHFETVPKTEQSQKRNSPIISAKESQKRDTDTTSEPITSEDKSSSVVPIKIKLTIQQLQEAWNLGPGARGAVKANRAGPERMKSFGCFSRRYSVDEITEAINAVAESDFLCGRTKEGFRADIDFLFSPKHMNRLLEGFYGRQSAA